MCWKCCIELARDVNNKYSGVNVSNEAIGKNQLFVMGDNRDVSRDSRSKLVGHVDEDQIVGKAIVRLYPFNQITRL